MAGTGKREGHRFPLDHRNATPRRIERPRMVSESIRTARLLMGVAADFEREALNWSHDPTMAGRCRATASMLDHTARVVLRTGDELLGENWHRAAVLTLSHVQLVRLFRNGAPWERGTTRRPAG